MGKFTDKAKNLLKRTKTLIGGVHIYENRIFINGKEITDDKEKKKILDRWDKKVDKIFTDLDHQMTDLHKEMERMMRP